ncbi:MAG: Na(+)/H(+) antiporter subunit D [Desulfobacterales bacterium]|nr:Na(+)/H(+) antiporter subunit D [Desulfobacterales bacterium]
MTSNFIPPALIFIVGAMLIPFLRGKAKSIYMLLIPVAGFWVFTQVSPGNVWNYNLWGYELLMGRIDRLSTVFSYIFMLMAFLGILFALKVKDDLQHVAGIIYAGATLGVVMAGDFLSLYLFWEVMAVSSTFLIIASRTRESRQAGFRYILVHLVGGLFLLAGIVLYFQKNGTFAFDYVGLDGLDSYLMLIGIALNAGAIPLHAWLPDAYPMGTPTSTVFLSAFTTKSAVYLLIRTFPGTELLIWVGAFMVFVPIFYAVLENDIRRVLAYSLLNQIGFMLVGIGIGTELSLNGSVAHAFCHILYKGLLFMAAGAVLHETGKIKCTEIGGLYKSMPWTCLFCIVGAASISAFPLFSGFVSKAMVVTATVDKGLILVYLVLQFASAGVFHHAGIKVPFFTFFGHDAGLKAKDPSWNMMLAMGIAAFACIFIGTYPAPLYNILPFTVDYVPYTGAHVVGQLQLLMFGALAFALLILSGYYPPEIKSINLDVDWFYRLPARAAYAVLDKGLNTLNRVSESVLMSSVKGATGFLNRMVVNLTLFCAVNIWLLQGDRGRRLAVRKERLYNDMMEGTVPIGLGAAVSVTFIILIYALS